MVLLRNIYFFPHMYFRGDAHILTDIYMRQKDESLRKTEVTTSR